MKTIITRSISKAASFIKNGEVVAFPTETVYGLGADCFNGSAVEKIFRLKGRAKDNPLIVHVYSKKDIKLLASEISIVARKLIEKFFPGPLTVILKKNYIVPDLVTADLDTIAIRMPSMKLSREFINKCGVPIAAPSANLSGSPSSVHWKHVLDDFKDKIPCILVGPVVKYGIESTVIDCSVDPPVLLRPGVITFEQLRKIDRRISLKLSGRIKSPGMKYKHYAPQAKVIIYNSKSYITDYKNSAYIGLDRPREKFGKICICSSLTEYAARIFKFFRDCDYRAYKRIYVQAVDERGLGLAIMNRIKKASSE